MLVLVATIAFAGPWDRYNYTAVGPWVGLSPDGSRIAWVDDAAPARLIVASADDGAEQLAVELHGGTWSRIATWANDAQLFVLRTDVTAAGWSVYDLDQRELWPVGSGKVLGTLPDALLMAEQDGKSQTITRVDLAMRTRTLVASTRGSPEAWLVEEDGTPRAALDLRLRTVVAESEQEMTFMTRWRLEDVDGGVITEGGQSQGYPNDGGWWVARYRVFGDEVIVVDGRSQRATDAVIRLNLETGAEQVVFESPGPDIRDVLVGDDGRVLAVAVEGARVRWHALEPDVAEDIRRLDALEVDVLIQQGTAESPRWSLRAWSPTVPAHQLIYDRASGRTWRVGPRYGAFEDEDWRPVQAIEVAASDGLPLTAYLATPDPESFGPPPYATIVLVHGGPWPIRDSWRFAGEVQRYAELGYGVLQVNYRGSDGLGNTFQEAWRGEWGGKMQTDLFDALDHVVAAGSVDPARVAIVGGSYGGYATLAAVTQHPDRMRCAVAASGPALLTSRTLRLQDLAFYGGLGPRRQRLERSPSRHVGKLAVPLLILTGDRDRAVNVRNVLPFVEEAERLGKELTFVLFTDAGHGGGSEADGLAWTAITEAFLSTCLGGDAPLELRDSLDGASLEVPLGADHIPGLADALTQ